MNSPTSPPTPPQHGALPPWPDRLPEGLPSCLARKALMTARAVTRDYNAALRDIGLPITQLSLLLRIRSGEGRTLVDLADSLALERTTLLRNLAQVEKAGLVVPVHGGGRAKRYRLTPAGEDILARAYPAWREIQMAFAETLGTTGLSGVAGGLDALRSAAAALDQAHPASASPPTRQEPGP